MSASLWGNVLTSIGDMFISLFGFMFTVLGVATTTLLALTFLAAVIRLIVKPIIGYKLDMSVGLGGFRKRETEARKEKQKNNKS